MFALALPSHADSTCKDGTTSTTTGRGACSGHGGVLKAPKAAKAAKADAAAPAAAAPAATPAPAAAAPATPKAAPAATAAKTAATSSTGNTDPTGATAKCKDGTYSKSKTHKGSCSHHGGVAEFLTP